MINAPWLNIRIEGITHEINTHLQKYEVDLKQRVKNSLENFDLEAYLADEVQRLANRHVEDMVKQIIADEVRAIVKRREKEILELVNKLAAERLNGFNVSVFLGERP